MPLTRRVEVWDDHPYASGASRLAVVQRPARLVTRRAVAADEQVTFVIALADPAYASLQVQRVIRLVYTTGATSAWRIQRIAVDDVAETATVTALSMLQDLARVAILEAENAEGVISDTIDLRQKTAAQVWDTLAAAALTAESISYWDRGTFNDSTVRDWAFEGATILAFLREAVSKGGVELQLRDDTAASKLKVDLLTSIGSSAGVADVRVRKNLRRTQLLVDGIRQATIVRPVGAEEATVARFLLEVTAVGAGTVDVQDPDGRFNPTTEDDQLAGAYAKRPDTGALVSITASTRPSSLTTRLTMTTTGFTVGSLFELRADSGGRLLTTIRLPSAVASYGPNAARLERTDLRGERNLVSDPWLRTVTADAMLPSGWTLEAGSLSDLTVETAPPFTHYGTCALGISAPVSDVVVQTPTIKTFPESGADTFSALWRWYNEIGSPLVNFRTVEWTLIDPATNTGIPGTSGSSQTANTVMEQGAAGVDLSGYPNGVKIRFRVVGGTSDGMVYLDLVQLTQSAAQAPPTEFSHANDLWAAGLDFLAAASEPEQSIDVDLADLELLDGTTYAADAITVGANLRVTHARLSIAREIRVLAAETTEFVPDQLPATRVTLATERRRLSSVGTSAVTASPSASASGGSGGGLTDLNASNLTSGTVPDGRFPATLPAASGANLTALNAAALSSGTVPPARLGSGTPSSSTFLDGSSAWRTLTSGDLPAHTHAASSITAGTFGSGSYVIGTNTTGDLNIGGTDVFDARLDVYSEALARSVGGFYANVALTQPVVQIWQDGSGASGPALHVRNDGSGNAIQVDDDSVGNKVFAVDSAGRVLLGTAVTGSSAGGDVVLANAKGLRAANSAGTDTKLLVSLTSGDVLQIGATRVAASLGSAFQANYYVELRDGAGNNIFIPAMNAGW